MKKVLIPLAEGFEEIEAITLIDVLRRGGAVVTTAALAAPEVTGAHGVKILADALLQDVMQQPFDMIALPGGMPGAKNLQQDERVLSLIRAMNERFAFLAAICAAPMVLAHAGVLEGKWATAYPGFLDAFPEVSQQAGPVQVDGTVVTGRGPGAAMDFALTLLECLVGPACRESVARSLRA
jgi:4-methyl-5(b-hydroxyethyl)-thiazole monophosphate biosynthesis